jgi:hypothetical protein
MHFSGATRWHVTARYPCNNQIVGSSAHCRRLLSHLNFLLSDECTGRPWLRSTMHRQKSQAEKALKCGSPPKPLVDRLNRFDYR